MLIRLNSKWTNSAWEHIDAWTICVTSWDRALNRLHHPSRKSHVQYTGTYHAHHTAPKISWNCVPVKSSIPKQRSRVSRYHPCLCNNRYHPPLCNKSLGLLLRFSEDTHFCSRQSPNFKCIMNVYSHSEWLWLRAQIIYIMMELILYVEWML